ncbi:Hypothetical predicted protein [Cloeon dipterum]|uniref:Uncharacterized protein n=1 Tax=Cloeon dipterum TaxID=197152 RepID=A0A8S1CP83_9INSE|nr:Hypothetical predicted protein [Cloeon dipterum]
MATPVNVQAGMVCALVSVSKELAAVVLPKVFFRSVRVRLQGEFGEESMWLILQSADDAEDKGSYHE